jgi:MFS family permease
MTDAGEEKAGRTAVPPGAWWAAILLLVLYILSTVDRGIVPMLVVPIQADLGLSDFQMSLVLGPAFSVCYAALGIPLGWAADRFPRRWVIFTGTSLWSICLTLSGLASSFTGLLLARLGVATGEASLSPAAYSLIGDKFPRDRLTTGLGIYGTGPKLGLSASYGVGAVVITLASQIGATHLSGVGTLQPWQLTLVMMGLPGIPIALLVFTMSEPRRTAARDGPPRAKPLT